MGPDAGRVRTLGQPARLRQPCGTRRCAALKRPHARHEPAGPLSFPKLLPELWEETQHSRRSCTIASEYTGGSLVVVGHRIGRLVVCLKIIIFFNIICVYL